ncbi:class I SAM-dependent methyltransferase [Undibacterium luofuense]|uniref:class I SAM-dependent methyltransferase n=1 Tax=Undibacterium luofuense TaxID=2828733 RepID=UPI0030EC1E2E
MQDYNLESVQTFGLHARRYAEKYADLPDYDQYYDALLAALPAQACAVLDLACGPGQVAAYLAARRPELDYWCVDRSAAMLEQVQQRLPQARCVQADCRDLQCLPEDLQFGAAAFCFGLSYLNEDDAARSLAELFRLLHSGAPLLLSSVAGDAALSGVQVSAGGDRVHSFYRSAGQIAAMVCAAGFQILEQALIASPASASQQTEDVVLLARRL